MPIESIEGWIFVEFQMKNNVTSIHYVEPSINVFPYHFKYKLKVIKSNSFEQLKINYAAE